MPKSIRVGSRGTLALRRLDVQNRDPNFVYRWGLAVDERIDELKELGYEFVLSDKTSGAEKGGDVALPTNVRRAGNLVLMRCKRELHEQREIQRARFARERLGMPIEGFITKARQAGVKVENEMDDK